MSVYKVKNSPNYAYEFVLRGHRFRGTTGCTNRRQAEAVEGQAREAAKKELAASKGARDVKLDFESVCERYWHEVGQHLKGEGADNCFRDLDRLLDYFGSDKRITDITNSDVAALVAWRRSHKVVRLRKIKKKLVQDPTAPLVAPATVNRSTTEVLKKLFMRARDTWGVQFEQWPRWKEHMLRAPQERVRELVDGEEQRIIEAVRDDYLPLIEFARITGLRAKVARTLEWSNVNWGIKQIVTTGKGSKRVVTPITDEVRELLWPLQGHHETFVFTFVARKTRRELGLVRGQRYPLTKEGLKSAWRRLRVKAGIDGPGGFRFHDFRHDLATKVLRKTGNMKLVQRVLNHSNLTTTAKYAHVLDGEVSAALLDHAQARLRKPVAAAEVGSPQNIPQIDVAEAAKSLENKAKAI